MAGSRTPRPKRRGRDSPTKPIKKPPKLAVWKPVDQAQVQDVIAHLFHFSSRPINTNAAPVGIRIRAATGDDLPLVGISTLPPGTVPLDYVRGARDAGLAKQIAAITDASDVAMFESIPENDAATIESSLGVLAQPAEFGTGRLDARLPQVLWPLDPENPNSSDYIALTPLPSTGLAAVVGRRADAIGDRARERAEAASPKTRWHRFERTVLEYGGTKTHNVARHARAMQRPLVFSGPVSNEETRRAWREHHQGISWLCARQEIDDWLEFRRRRLASGSTRSDARSRSAEARMIRAIARGTLRRARAVESRLLDKLKSGPGDLVSADLDEDTRALIDRSLRTADWPVKFATRLLGNLARAEFRQGKSTLSLGIADVDALILSSIAAEEAAR